MTPGEYKHIEERLSRMENALNRLTFLIDGDPSYRIVGFPEQLAAYIESNEAWKKATENRVRALENDNQIVITPTTAVLLGVIFLLCLAVAYFVITWLQSAG